jgi:hypothetical protein
MVVWMARKNLLQCHHVTDEKMIFKSVLHALARVSILFGHGFPDGGLDGSEEVSNLFQNASFYYVTAEKMISKSVVCIHSRVFQSS